MQKHTKIYFKAFDYGEQDFIPCEVEPTLRASDVHHIWGRGKGKDVIENLMGLSRKWHDRAHKGLISKEELQEIHNKFMKCNMKT